MEKRIAKNMRCWEEIAGDVSKNRKLGYLQPCDREIALSEAQWEFVQRHDPAAYPHRGQAIGFASRCIQHATKRESAQISKFYGPKVAQDAETKREFDQIREFCGSKMAMDDEMARQFAHIRKFFGPTKTKGNEAKREFAQALVSIGPQENEETRREFAQVFSVYRHIMAQDDEVSWTVQASVSSSAIPPLESIAAPEPEPEDHRLAAIMEISPTVAQICSLYLEGFTRQETAQIMNVTPAQILYDLQIAKTSAERQFNQPSLLRVPSSTRRRSGRIGRPAKMAQPADVAQQMSMF